MEPIRITASEAAEHEGMPVRLYGHVHAIRKMGALCFIVLRDRSGLIQAVVEDPRLSATARTLASESTVVLSGTIRRHGGSAAQAELAVDSLAILSQPAQPLPVQISKISPARPLPLATLLDYRPLTLRSPLIRAIFRVQAVLCRAFREFLAAEGFVEIHSPKIVTTGTEGGANLFPVDYFQRKAFLAQSPQFYKQIMVGSLERVFEVGHVYRAEDHDTSRHLNEYVSMDLEMAFIESEEDIMNLEERLLAHLLQRVAEECRAELELHNASISPIGAIPRLTLPEAIAILQNRLGWCPGPGGGDLDPEGERLLSAHFGEAVFVTGYPRTSRPFYTMPAADGIHTRSFDLIFRGMEITTGGQRIHAFRELVASMESRGLNPDDFADYLQCFRHGMPPHGGLAIGLERLTMKLLGLKSVKEASLFPRDRIRLGH